MIRITQSRINIHFLVGILITSLGLSLLTFNSSYLNQKSLKNSSISANLKVSDYNSPLEIIWGEDGDVDIGRDLILDSSNNIYVAGYSNGFSSSVDAIIAKFDKNGNPLMTIIWDKGYNDAAYGITLDSLGNIYITGNYDASGSGNYDIFIAKFDSNGNSLDNITLGGPNNDDAYDIEVDNSGNIYIAGSLGSQDTFIAKFDSSGAPLFNITWDRVEEDKSEGLALDDSGNIYYTGYNETAPNYDAFVAKSDNLGNGLFNRTWDKSNNDFGYDIALDSNENLYITGRSAFDAFVAKYSNSGTHLWDFIWAGTGNDYGIKLALDASDNIYMAGYFVSGTPDPDAFIAKFDSAGNSLCNLTWGGSTYDYFYAIDLDNEGTIYVTGSTNSPGNEDIILAIYSVDDESNGEIDDDDDDDDDDVELMIPGYNLLFVPSILIIFSYIVKFRRK